ncbi:MAG: 3D-(3,5/4)-trihydroxycyclohexane-1,2-dione acylhydrolase (decyclizing) [Breznakia sp.]
METVKLTVAQAIIKFLDQQYIAFDHEEIKFVEGMFTILGHGNAVGLGEALQYEKHRLQVFQGRNEQGMCHSAIAFSKEWNRKKILPCIASVGPGSANMVTAAATATVNNIPLLLFPADTFASRQPDPVLQQLECPHDLTISTNDAFKPVCKYFDRISRAEQLMTAMINAMRVLTNIGDTGAVAIALPQDVEGEVYAYPTYFFKKRVHRLERRSATVCEVEDVVKTIASSKKPLMIVGGGVRYSEAGEMVEAFSTRFNIPFGETQAGKSACISSHENNLGGIGVTGTLASNHIAKSADCIIAIGTRLTDFTTSSKWLFQADNVQIVTINASEYHAQKMDAISAIGDAKTVLRQIYDCLDERQYQSSYTNEISDIKTIWEAEMDRLANYEYDENFEPIIKERDERTISQFHTLTNSILTQTQAIMTIRRSIDKHSTIVTAGGSLPSCLQRIWTSECRDTYHAEYGYSCMGYECSAVLGVKLAKPDIEAYTLVGDGSFQMLHSEIATAVQERKKINILLFDNAGFGCINNLEMVNHLDSFATEFRYRNQQGLDGDLMMTDYAMIAQGYGLKSYTVRTKQELITAIQASKKIKQSVLIDIKVLPKTMTTGYESWWNIGLAERSNCDRVQENLIQNYFEQRKKARKY